MKLPSFDELLQSVGDLLRDNRRLRRTNQKLRKKLRGGKSLEAQAPFAAPTVVQDTKPEPKALLPTRQNSRPLTRRQRQVAQMLIDGLDLEAIADALAIDFYTARAHQAQMYRRVNVHSLKEFIAYCKANEPTLNFSALAEDL